MARQRAFYLNCILTLGCKNLQLMLVHLGKNLQTAGWVLGVGVTGVVGALNEWNGDGPVTTGKDNNEQVVSASKLRVKTPLRVTKDIRKGGLNVFSARAIRANSYNDICFVEIHWYLVERDNGYFGQRMNGTSLIHSTISDNSAQMGTYRGMIPSLVRPKER